VRRSDTFAFDVHVWCFVLVSISENKGERHNYKCVIYQRVPAARPWQCCGCVRICHRHCNHPAISPFIVSSSVLSLFDGNTNCFSRCEPSSQMPTIHFWFCFYNLFTLLALSAALWVPDYRNPGFDSSFLFLVSSCNIFSISCLHVLRACCARLSPPIMRLLTWKRGPSQARTETHG
jgi:hypothetical protein